MAAVSDRPNDVRVAIRGEAGDEERRAHAVTIEDRKDPGNADERPVRLVRHHREPTGGVGCIEQHRAFAIDVERQCGRCAGAAGPAPYFVFADHDASFVVDQGASSWSRVGRSVRPDASILRMERVAARSVTRSRHTLPAPTTAGEDADGEAT